MFFVLRMLTLVAFAAHAVLGCCLSHGSCMQDHASANVSHCSEHHCHTGDVHDSSHHHDDQPFTGDSEDGHSCPTDPPGHPNHCDDAKCVFGIATHGPYSTIWTLGVLGFWGGGGALGFLPSQQCCLRSTPSDSPPPTLCNRAVLQVWLI